MKEGRIKGHDDLEIANGNTEYPVGTQQERQGIARDEAKRQVRDSGA